MATPFIIADEAGRQHALDRIARLDLADKRWEITVRRHRKRRSNRQNNLMWMWIDEITPYVSEATGYEKDEIHKLFKQNFLPAIKLEMGGLAAEDWSTKDLDTKEMSEYCDRIFRWASGFGIVLTLPPEIVEEGYDGPPRPTNDDDDWRTVANDIIALIDDAPNRGRLEEIDALNERGLIAMKNCAFDLYNRVMDAMEQRGLDLDRKNGAAEGPEPARQKAGVG